MATQALSHGFASVPPGVEAEQAIADIFPTWIRAKRMGPESGGGKAMTKYVAYRDRAWFVVYHRTDHAGMSDSWIEWWTTDRMYSLN